MWFGYVKRLIERGRMKNDTSKGTPCTDVRQKRMKQRKEKNIEGERKEEMGTIYFCIHRHVAQKMWTGSFWLRIGTIGWLF
jgi:hypothetical protein